MTEAAAACVGYLVLPLERRVHRDLEDLPAGWLVEWDGPLALPFRFVPAAIVRWPGAAKPRLPSWSQRTSSSRPSLAPS